MQSLAPQELQIRPKLTTSEIDALLMQVALKEAKKGEGKTAPNPLVGAVIARDGEMLSSGYHAKAGSLHAEIEALRHLKCISDACGATLYVTLEPCSTFGKTSPCTKAIIDAGVKRVVYGATDPNPLHQGEAEKILSAAGIEVVTGVLTKECQELNKHWNHRMQTGLPWVIAKYGMSLDGRISSFPGRRWITSEKSRRDAMRLRAQVEAILVGGGTIRDDDPSLTLRGLSKKERPFSQPWRIVWSRSGDIPRSAQVLTDKECSKTIVLTERSLRRALQDLAERGISSVLIEGGGRTLGEAFDNHLVDEVRFYVAPIMIGGPVLAVGGIGYQKGRRLTQVFHNDHLRRSASQMDTVPKFEVLFGQCVHTEPLSKYVSALTRSLPLVSPFQSCLKEVEVQVEVEMEVSPEEPRLPVVPHQPSRSPRHNQYEISGLTSVSYRMLGEDLVISGLVKKFPNNSLPEK
jgi:diaminohydroxyphosphoribosylaminopyrimidine deaminase/5-amino-6-(5-phosphoribosylamino)uracil reductase